MSTVAGLASIVIGLYLSFQFDVASGAMIVLILFAFFLLAVTLSPRRSYMQKLLKPASSPSREED